MINRVRELRETRSLSIEELSMRIGVSVRFLSALEENACVTSVDVALRLARALETTVETLFGETSSERFHPVLIPQTLPEAADEELNDEVAEVVNVEETSALEVVTDVVPTKKSRKRTTKKVDVELKEDVQVVLETVVCPYRSEIVNATFDELFNTEEENGSTKEPSLLSGLEDDVELVSKHRVGAPRHSQKVSSPNSRTAIEEGLESSPKGLNDPTVGRPIRYFDLFCGIGGFRYAAQNTLAQMKREGQCVLSCDVDLPAQQSYAANFGETPFGDVGRLPSEEIPDVDLLFAGFPCQSFSIIGLRKGFADETKGSLFFQIARILRDKRPRAFVLENVRQLTTHDSGRTFEIILRVLQEELGYYVDWRVLNALDCGLPQKRERVVVVGSTEPFDMAWPKATTVGATLAEILEDDFQVDRKYFASEEIVRKRKEAHTSDYFPAIWHENKSGNISSYPYSCALRAGASYNYLLVNGERRLTPREMLRLQGFPDSFKVVVSDTQLRKQAGNAAPVNLIQRALERFLPLVFQSNAKAN